MNVFLRLVSSITLIWLGLFSISHANVILPNYEANLLISDNSVGTNYTDATLNRLDPNVPDSPFNGVVSVYGQFGTSQGLCSGTVVGKREILLAAHCVDINGDAISDVAPGVLSLTVNFNHNPTSQSIQAVSATIHPDYDGLIPCAGQADISQCLYDDIAIITLAEDIPEGVKIYDIAPTHSLTATSGSTDGSTMTMVGYGAHGNGTGYLPPPSIPAQAAMLQQKLVGTNILDLLLPDDELTHGLAELFYADFDGLLGTQPIDAFCVFEGICSSVTANESTIGPGDSGGAMFIYDDDLDEFLLAGVNTFNFTNPALNLAEGAFGTVFGGVVLDSYHSWINDNITHAVPEPLSLFLMLPGMFLLMVKRRSKN